MFVVIADPTVAFVDAVKARLSADTTLMALVTTVTGHVSQATRTAYPYVYLGARGNRPSVDAGAMGVPGGQVSLQVDIWSDAKGAYTATAIASRIYALLERRDLTVAGFILTNGSLMREMQDVFDEPDPDNPDQVLYHAVQQWTALIEGPA